MGVWWVYGWSVSVLMPVLVLVGIGVGVRLEQVRLEQDLHHPVERCRHGDSSRTRAEAKGEDERLSRDDSSGRRSESAWRIGQGA